MIERVVWALLVPKDLRECTQGVNCLTFDVYPYSRVRINWKTKRIGSDKRLSSNRQATIIQRTKLLSSNGFHLDPRTISDRNELCCILLAEGYLFLCFRLSLFESFLYNMRLGLRPETQGLAWREHETDQTTR